MTVPMSSWPAIHVFVYGTLRRGEQRDINLLKPAPHWMGRASVAGVLYDLGDYPGLRLCTSPTAQQRVEGEVYEISHELERLLDEIEEVSVQPAAEYVRRHVVVQLLRQAQTQGDATTTGLNCLVYEVAHDRIVRCPVIADGDWVSYRQQRHGRTDL